MAKAFTIDQARAANIAVPDKPARASQAVHDTVTALRANRRSGTAHTKSRSDMGKPDKKPWRQKGTGRARSGTVNSPLGCGGSVVFGPKPRSYAKKVNKSTRRVAFSAALASRIQAGDVVLAEAFSIADGRTKTFVAALEKLSDTPKTLVIAGAFDEATYRAARNHGATRLVTAADVNVEQLVNYRRIVITSDALPVLAQRTAA